MTRVLITQGAPHLVGVTGWRDETAGVIYIGDEFTNMDKSFIKAVLCTQVTCEPIRTGKAATQAVKDANADPFAT